MIDTDRRPGRSSSVGRLVTLTSLFGALCIAVLGFGAGTATAAPHNWDEVAQCESGGDWTTDTGNGFFGGLQFTPETWKSHGGAGLASEASKAEQIMVAEKVLQTQGQGAWPVCGRFLTTEAPQSDSAPVPEPEASPAPETDVASTPAAETVDESTSTMIARAALEGARAIAAASE